jgi:diguanylate cyclase (GGDEF)-like protein/PAS domain S-box-containing protein
VADGPDTDRTAEASLAPIVAVGSRQLRAILDNLDDGVYVVDRDRSITFWSAGAERMTGFTADEVVGSRCADGILAHVDEGGINLCVEGCPLHCSMDTGTDGEAHVFLHHREGHRVPVKVHTMALRDDDGTIVGAVEVFCDQTAQRALEEREHELERLVMLDELTRVGNRRAGMVALDRRLAELTRYGLPFGLLYLDLDNFKELNDRLGHAAGDEALRMVAATLAHNVRSGDEVMRWGGEEFVVVCPGVDVRLLTSLAERLKVLVATSVIIDEHRTLKTTVSIGGTLALPDDDIPTLLARADALMYVSKAAGRDGVTIG